MLVLGPVTLMELSCGVLRVALTNPGSAPQSRGGPGPGPAYILGPAACPWEKAATFPPRLSLCAALLPAVCLGALIWWN